MVMGKRLESSNRRPGTAWPFSSTVPGMMAMRKKVFSKMRLRRLKDQKGEIEKSRRLIGLVTVLFGRCRWSVEGQGTGLAAGAKLRGVDPSSGVSVRSFGSLSSETMTLLRVRSVDLLEKSVLSGYSIRRNKDHSFVNVISQFICLINRRLVEA